MHRTLELNVFAPQLALNFTSSRATNPATERIKRFRDATDRRSRDALPYRDRFENFHGAIGWKSREPRLGYRESANLVSGSFASREH